MNKLWDIVKAAEVWHAAVHRATKSWTWLNNWKIATKQRKERYLPRLVMTTCPLVYTDIILRRLLNCFSWYYGALCWPFQGPSLSFPCDHLHQVSVSWHLVVGYRTKSEKHDLKLNSNESPRLKTRCFQNLNPGPLKPLTQPLLCKVLHWLLWAHKPLSNDMQEAESMLPLTHLEGKEPGFQLGHWSFHDVTCSTLKRQRLEKSDPTSAASSTGSVSGSGGSYAGFNVLLSLSWNSS